MASLFFLFRVIKVAAYMQFSGREVLRSRTNSIEFVWVPTERKRNDTPLKLAFKYCSLPWWMKFLSDLMLYVIRLVRTLFMWWDVNLSLIYLGVGLKWSHYLYGLTCVNFGWLNFFSLHKNGQICGLLLILAH